MLILGINTVADACDVALTDGEAAIAELSQSMSNGHDTHLAPLVERLMREAGKSFADLDRVAVIVGPGSFTGVRVGVAFARGLSLALGARSVGVTSLEAIEGLPSDRRVLGLLPAKRRPPQRTWWAQVLDKGRGVADPLELNAEGVCAIAAEVEAVCGGIDAIPDVGKPGVSASPTAKAAAMWANRIEGAAPAARPVYVREPDATPMERS